MQTPTTTPRFDAAMQKEKVLTDLLAEAKAETEAARIEMNTARAPRDMTTQIDRLAYKLVSSNPLRVEGSFPSFGVPAESYDTGCADLPMHLFRAARVCDLSHTLENLWSETLSTDSISKRPRGLHNRRNVDPNEERLRPLTCFRFKPLQEEGVRGGRPTPQEGRHAQRHLPVAHHGSSSRYSRHFTLTRSTRARTPPCASSTGPGSSRASRKKTKVCVTPRAESNDPDAYRTIFYQRGNGKAERTDTGVTAAGPPASP